MGADHDPKDDVAFYAATLGRTRKIELSTTGAQLSDDEGPLPVGRHLVHVDISGNAIAWVSVGKYKKGVVISLPDDVPALPMQHKTFVLFEYNVRNGVNDRIGGVMSNGEATLYITEISFRL